MKKILNAIFVALLITQVTSLFLAVKIVGFSSSIINLLTILGLIVYIFANIKIVAKVTLEPNNFLFLVLCFVIPLYVSLLDYSVFSGNFDVRLLGVRLLLCLLFLATATYCLKNGVSAIAKPIEYSIFIAFLGLLLSIIAPSLFLIFAEENGAKSVTAGRAFGFYLQPNIAAASLCALFFALACVKRGIPGILISVTCFLGVALTASRAGFALFVLIFSCIYVYSSDRKFLENTVRKMPNLLLAGVISVVGLIGTVIVYENLDEDSSRKFSASKRLTAVLEVGDTNSTSSVTTDSGNRAELARSYFGYIEDNPLGYGLGATQRMTAEGVFVNSPHNQYVIMAFEFGVIGLLFYLVWLLSLLLRTKRGISFAFSISLFSFLLLYGLVSNTILSNRCIYVALAIYTVVCLRPATNLFSFKVLSEIKNK